MSLSSFLVTSSLNGANYRVSDGCYNFLRPDESDIPFKLSVSLLQAS